MPRYLTSINSTVLQRRSIRDLRLSLDKIDQRWAKVRAINKHLAEVITLSKAINITYPELILTLGQSAGGEGAGNGQGAVSFNRLPPDSQHSQSLTTLPVTVPKEVPPVESSGSQCDKGDTGVEAKALTVVRLHNALNGHPRAASTWTEGGRTVTVGVNLNEVSRTYGELVPMAPLVGKSLPEVVEEERNRGWPEKGRAKVLGNVSNPKMIAITLEDGRRCSLWKPRNVGGLPKSSFFDVVLDNKPNGIYRLV